MKKSYQKSFDIWTNKWGQKITITGDNNLYLYNDVIRVYNLHSGSCQVSCHIILKYVR